MTTNVLNYELPTELIAQAPNLERSNSRVMVITKSSGDIQHTTFANLGQLLKKTDRLVLNDTKVIKARLMAKKESGAKIEIFLLSQQSSNEWVCFLKPGKRVREGMLLHVSPVYQATVKEKRSDGCYVIQFNVPTVDTMLEKYGIMPLPPYIKDPNFELANKYEADYQTIFASKPGAVAAPTAGRHFTQLLIEQLKTNGIGTESITLHVGAGTFLPIKEVMLEKHKMHEERCFISKETARRLIIQKQKGHRIVAVGTTVVRALESAYIDKNTLEYGNYCTDLFIKPGHHFQMIDALITNFHLPKSTLLLLVAAFCGESLMKEAYQQAIKQEYRFYSFGDAMLILP